MGARQQLANGGGVKQDETARPASAELIRQLRAAGRCWRRASRIGRGDTGRSIDKKRRVPRMQRSFGA